MNLGRAKNKTRRIMVHDDPAATLSAYPRPIRQLAVTGLGHDQPTLLITNQAQLPARQVIQSYARLQSWIRAETPNAPAWRL